MRLPLSEESVRVVNPEDSVQLAATLTLPDGRGQYPAILLIPGSGKNDRDETVCGHRLFATWAAALAASGFAALRLDDRGAGESGGDKEQVTHRELVADIAAALGYLATHPSIHAARIGVLGHSEGGILAAATAASTTPVAFAVLLATPGLPGDQLVLQQAENISRSAGAPEPAIAHERAMNKEVFRLVMNHPAPRPLVIECLNRHLIT
jgi:dienelactone hydrolase